MPNDHNNDHNALRRRLSWLEGRVEENEGALRDAQGLHKKVDTFLTQMKIQLDLCEKKIEGQAETQEMFKRSLFGQNTGAKVVAAVPNGACEEKATLYFRVGGRMNTTLFFGIEVGKWFALPPRDCVDSEGCISPFFLEPPCDLGFKTTPLAIDHQIFLISDVMEGNEETKMQPFRKVHFLNTQNVKETEDKPWNEASSLVGKHAQLCHFLAANNKIYAFGFLNNGFSLCVKYIECDMPTKGWKVLYFENVEPCSSEGPLYSFYNVSASTIEFVPSETGRRARHALMFSSSCVLSYDFDTNEYELSELDEVFCFNEIHSSLCCDEGLFLLLIQDFDDRFCLVVYDHCGRERGFTKVFGLDDFLPEDYTGHCRLPVLRLVDLGNNCLCLVWPHVLGAYTEVQCTKFTFEKENRKYRATIVSSQVYRVKSFSLHNFEAVVVCGNEKILESAVGSSKGKINHGGQQRQPDYEITTSPNKGSKELE